jgi:hypothetical protein
MAPEIVVTSFKDPNFSTLDNLFGKGQKPLKRIGIVIFEGVVQPTRAGLAESDLIYMNAAGKQLITEDFLTIWDQAMPLLEKNLDYVPVKRLKKAKSVLQYGLDQTDYVKGKSRALAPDDIFYLPKGKETTPLTVMNPRGLRDVSFLLVPANELMGGPKWSEHNKHYLNDAMKELKLDAAIIVMSSASWTAAHMDKHTGEHYPEQLKVKINASILTSLSDAQERGKKARINDVPKVNLCYRTYEAQLLSPVTITVQEDQQNFQNIDRELLTPLMKQYRDLSFMVIDTIASDLKKTH